LPFHLIYSLYPALSTEEASRFFTRRGANATLREDPWKDETSKLAPPGRRLDIGHGPGECPGYGTAAGDAIGDSRRKLDRTGISPGPSGHCPVPLEQAAESRGQAQVRRYLAPGQRNEPTNWDPFTSNTGTLGWGSVVCNKRFIDAIQSIPGLILALVMVVVLGPSTTTAITAIAIVNIPAQARVVRGAVLSVAKDTYIDAAQAIGCSDVRIMLAHILPNIVAPVIVLASVLFGNAIIIEASLSFLGLGTPPPTPSWGAMRSGAGRQFMERVPTLALFPGLAISIAVLAFNLFGDMLRDILDPRLRSGSA
jgi:ABC-type methionine transport system permease subunit